VKNSDPRGGMSASILGTKNVGHQSASGSPAIRSLC